MELIAKGSFYRDLSLITNRKLKLTVKESLKKIQEVKTVSEINNLKKLDNFNIYYRIKIEEDYRMGIIIRGKKIWLIRFGHRSNFYNKFP